MVKEEVEEVQEEKQGPTAEELLAEAEEQAGDQQVCSYWDVLTNDGHRPLQSNLQACSTGTSREILQSYRSESLYSRSFKLMHDDIHRQMCCWPCICNRQAHAFKHQEYHTMNDARAHVPCQLIYDFTARHHAWPYKEHTSARLQCVIKSLGTLQLTLQS